MEPEYGHRCGEADADENERCFHGVVVRRVQPLSHGCFSEVAGDHGCAERSEDQVRGCCGATEELEDGGSLRGEHDGGRGVRGTHEDCVASDTVGTAVEEEKVVGATSSYCHDHAQQPGAELGARHH